MINANELRMGSLIEKDNVMYKFLSLEQNHASTSEYRWYWVETLDGKLGHYYYSHFNPIPLTPEILEKCGFAFKPTGEEVYEQIWSIDGFEIWEHDSGFCHDFHYGGDVKHLHQLQNLYFALCGEELNYTP